MNFRNPTYNAQGGIDCEIEHPEFGWIPFTATKNDGEALGRLIFEAAKNLAAPYVPVVSRIQVDMERDRRISTGKTFNLTGYENPIRIAGDSVTRTNLADVAVMAQLKVGLGQGSDTLVWRDEDNVDHTITFSQVLELFALGFAFFNAVWASAWPLKDADPIPLDYADDGYWP